MKAFVILRWLFYASSATLVAAGAERKLFGRDEVDDDNGCDVRHALHVLERLSVTGESFCTSLLHEPKGATETESFVATATEVCSVRTETSTEHGTFTTTIYGKTIVLPQLTFTSYSSTILVPSGSPRLINKRSSPSTPASLLTCAGPTISSACSSLLAPTTTRTTSTSTHTKHQCLSTTTVTVTTTRHTATSVIPFTATPPPVSLVGVGVLTTTVPADCVSGPYAYPAGTVPEGDLITFSEYPYQPGTLVECCVACHYSPNCIALAFNPDSDKCSFLTRIGASSGVGVGGVCPLGVQDFDFGLPQPGFNILPGPCGM